MTARPEPRAVSPQQVALTTGLSLCTVYRAIRSGEIRAVKRRSRWLIATDELRRFCGEPIDADTATKLMSSWLDQTVIPPSVRGMVNEALGAPSRTRGPAHARG